ncbi:MAG TPA: hypothetical protein VM529_19715 [Gemmata sp.]|nr:hypothetical protein [Gemmata sp.]
MHTNVTIDLSFLDETPLPWRPPPPFAAPDSGSLARVGWSTSDAIAVENAADSLVERLGVSGLDPLIQSAAARCVEAHVRRDLLGVRDACREVERRARELGARAG